MIVNEMNKDAFWSLIEQAKEHCGQDLGAFTQWLTDRLVSMGPRQALDFHNILHGYRDLSYKYGLWKAASIMCNGCSDDGFTDFRGWLIAQGRDTYLAALKDPDSLAGIPAYGGCSFEPISYVGEYAFEKLTGLSVYLAYNPNAVQALKEELKKDIVYGDGIDYPYTWSEAADYLPKLCAKYIEPEELARMIRERNDTWNVTSPDIQTARKTAPKSKKVQNRGDAR